MRPDTIIFLEENIGGTLCNVNYSNIIFNPSPRIMEIKKIMEIKTKINGLGLIKLKSFCTAKKTINKIEPTDWEKIFANNVTDKGLVSEIYKQFMRLNIIKTTQSKSGQKT